jgi:hypothetical protein
MNKYSRHREYGEYREYRGLGRLGYYYSQKLHFYMLYFSLMYPDIYPTLPVRSWPGIYPTRICIRRTLQSTPPKSQITIAVCVLGFKTARILPPAVWRICEYILTATVQCYIITAAQLDQRV